MKHIALAFCLSIVAFAGRAEAQDIARSAVCLPENSQATTIAAIAADPKAWIARCVAVDGLYANERVYADPDAIYGLNGNFIGGFIDGMNALPGAWRGAFIGRVTDCEAAEATLLNAQLRAPGISVNGRTLGCIEPKGPMLMFMTATGLKASGIKRRLPGARGGDLLAAPADWEHRAALEERAKAFEEAMAGGDVAALGQVLGNGYRAGMLLSDTDTAFAAMKKQVTRTRIALMDRDAGEDRMAAEACFCLTRDCAKLWPVDSRDADNQPGRPYACLRMEGVLLDGKWRYHLDASHDVAGLEEPKR